MKKKIINLTPHEIRLPDRTIEPSGTVARCREISRPAGTCDGVELIARRYAEVLDLPERLEDTLLIVSALVRMARPERRDLASPGDLIRDESGNIIGTKNLVVN